MQITAGGNYQAQCNLLLPTDLVPGAYLVWELADLDGISYTTGTASSLISVASAVRGNEFKITGLATVAIPRELPLNNSGSPFILKWGLIFPDGNRFFTQEQLTINPPFYTAAGALPTVELFQQPAELRISLPTTHSEVLFEVYNSNALIFTSGNLTSPEQAADGYIYTGIFDTSLVSPNLEAFTVIWKYRSSNSGPYNMETAPCFVVTPSMMSAYSDVVKFLNRSYIDSNIAPGTELDPVSVMSYLRMGMDMFNGAVVPTTFTMQNAQGGIRAFWLNYSMVYAARSQYLAEGMKAFQYSGQVVNLDIDRTPYWEQIASSLEAQITDQITNFKSNLYNKGITGGDGSNASLSQVNVGAIGIGLSVVSPIRSFGIGISGPRLY